MKIIKDLSISQSNGTVIAFGNFDGMHLGHREILKNVICTASKYRLNPLVVTFDKHTRHCFEGYELKNFSISDLREKVKMIEELGVKILYLVDFNKLISQISALDFIKILCNNLKAKYIITGINSRFGNNAEGDINFLKKYEDFFHYKTIIVDDVKRFNIHCSSSQIRKSLINGDIEGANRLLGRKYKIYGRIIKGSAIGRKIGYPTANIKSSDELLIPRLGVYSGDILIGKELHHGIINIGRRPTLNHSKDIVIEMNIFDFYQDIYGHYVEIYPTKNIRNEMKFSSIKELSQQIELDITNVKNTR